MVCGLAEFGRTPKVNPLVDVIIGHSVFHAFAGAAFRVGVLSVPVTRLVLFQLIALPIRARLLQRFSTVWDSICTLKCPAREDAPFLWLILECVKYVSCFPENSGDSRGHFGKCPADPCCDFDN